MAQLPGKKVGSLVVTLKRNRGRGQGRGEVVKELRLDHAGVFHAYHDGVHFSSKTQEGLVEQLRAAIERTIDIVWDRYLIIDYDAEAWPTIAATGRPHKNGSFTTLDLTEDRACLQGNLEQPRWHALHHRQVITQIGLKWVMLEISRPYEVPEKPGKPIRSQREIFYVGAPSTTAAADDDAPTADEDLIEKPGDPKEMESDRLPIGAVLWTAEREALLRDVLVAMGQLDARLVALFSGDPDALAAKLDAAATSGTDRLLTAAKPCTHPNRDYQLGMGGVEHCPDCGLELTHSGQPPKRKKRA